MAAVTEPVPDWCQPGASVGVISSGGGRGPEANLSEVRTVGKRYVVLTNGARFTRPHLVRDPGDYSPRYRLVPREDPDLRRLLVEQRRRAQAIRLARAVKAWRDHPAADTQRDLRQAIAGVQVYLWQDS